MMDKQLSCIDCAAKSCLKGDNAYPDFCVTTHMDPETLREALDCYSQEEVHEVTVAAPMWSVSTTASTPAWRRSWISPGR